MFDIDCQSTATTTYRNLNSRQFDRRLETIFSLLPCGVVIIDARGFVKEINQNAEELLGENLIGHRWTAIINRSFSPQDDDGHEVSLRNGKLVSIATSSLTPEPGQLVLITDMTQTRQLQEQFARKKRLVEMGEMTAHLAHQIRTPLSTALLYAKNARNKKVSAEKQELFLEKIIDSLNNMEQQVRDMLLFARGGNHTLSPITVDEFVAQISTGVGSHFSINDGITLQVNTHNETLICNHDSLLGAVYNLIHNAKQACTTDPRIIVSLSTGGNIFHISVKDNGCGMSEKTLENIRVPFFTTKAKGTGLGLAVVRAVVEAHQGKFSIESKINQGTTIDIHLPLIASEEM